MTPCIECGASKSGLPGKRCTACSWAYYDTMAAINQIVGAARRKGLLVSPKTLQCVDCGKPGHDYDHRDYSRPLDVQPVCRSCNLKRGPAIWRPAYEALPPHKRKARIPYRPHPAPAEQAAA